MMNTITDKELANLFRDYPLYSKILFYEDYPIKVQFEILDYFEDKAYKYYCPTESDYHTFKIKKHSMANLYSLGGENIDYFLDDKERVNHSFHLTGVCQSCGFSMDFLLNVFTDTPFKRDAMVMPKIYLRKIGQFPPVERSPEKEILDYLTDEDKENYKKALSNLSVSYGIGAFAYFRRIIENEIKRIVKDISQLEFENTDKLRKAWADYEQNHQMTNLIDNIYPFLPKSLKESGHNPIKLLHQQLSGGIHEYSEIECLDKAKKVDVLLRYVIRKVNSEKFELTEVRKAMKGLRDD